MSIIKSSEVQALREENKRKTLVFCSGCFDLTHAGHVLFFEDCKKFGDVLAVMVATDYNILNYKGKGRPILNEYLRLKMIDALKPVDFCFLDLPTESNDLLAPVDAAFKALKPDVYVVNSDAFDIPKRREMTGRLNIEMKVLERTAPSEFDNVSTSGI